MAQLLDMPIDILVIILGYLFAEQHRSITRPHLKIFHIRPTYHAILQTCRSMFKVGIPHYKAATHITMLQMSGGKWERDLLQDLQAGVSKLKINKVENLTAINKICIRFPTLQVVKFVTRATFLVEPPIILPFSPTGANKLPLILQHHPRFTSAVQAWQTGAKNVPQVKISFKVDRQVQCREFTQVAHRWIGTFHMDLNNFESLAAKGDDVIQDRGEGCKCCSLSKAYGSGRSFW